VCLVMASVCTCRDEYPAELQQSVSNVGGVFSANAGGAQRHVSAGIRRRSALSAEKQSVHSIFTVAVVNFAFYFDF